MSGIDEVDLSEVRRLLALALERAESMDGIKLPPESQHKDRVRALAETQRDLLYLAHLCDTANTFVLGEYHAVRGFTDHLPK